jgi:DNA-binding response OmpR family regulator
MRREILGTRREATMNARATILVVDDEPGIRFFLEEMLANDGHQVVAVDNGKRALEHIAAEEFDLALVDLRLKDVGGLEVLSTLRHGSPDTVVIVLTGHASLDSAVEALRQGAHDYLFKPCKTVDLRESIRRGLLKRQQKVRQRALMQQLEQQLSSLQDLRTAIAEPPAAPSSPTLNTLLVAPPDDDTSAREQARFLKRGGLIVDLMRHVITLDGELLELSPTEFDLLAYLISEAPRVVPPQELVREVQGYETEPWEASETVRYHIYRIRQKIKGAAGRDDIVRTVRGVGYTIDE